MYIVDTISFIKFIVWNVKNVNKADTCKRTVPRIEQLYNVGIY